MIAKMKNKRWLVLIAMFVSGGIWGQTITLQECYKLARENYPMIQQMQLIEKSRDLSLSNINKSYLPQIDIKGRASYQSDVTEIPIHMPGVNIPTLSKDQYKAYAEVSQVIYAGGSIKAQKNATNLNAKVQQQQIEVSLHQVKERINQLYFGILMLDEQIRQNQTFQQDIQAGLDELHAAVEHGVALKSSEAVLQAQKLEIAQTNIELQANREAFLQLLGQFIHQSPNSLQLSLPTMPTINAQSRPELELFALQKQQIGLQKQLLNAKITPKVSLFLQGGFGRPGLNMLSNDFEPYYIGGLQLVIPLSGLYSRKKELNLLSVRKQTIDVQKQTFLFNNQLQIDQKNKAVEKWEKLLASDAKIIALRKEIKNTALSQLKHGTITAKDYLDKASKLHRARINQKIHQLKKLSAIYQLNTLK